MKEVDISANFFQKPHQPFAGTENSIPGPLHQRRDSEHYYRINKISNKSANLTDQNIFAMDKSQELDMPLGDLNVRKSLGMPKIPEAKKMVKKLKLEFGKRGSKGGIENEEISYKPSKSRIRQPRIRENSVANRTENSYGL